MHKILLDTNAIVDYLMGREPGCSDCKQLMLMHSNGEHAVYTTPLSLKDAYYLIGMQLKRMERQATGQLSESAAKAANEIAWQCIRVLADSILLLPVGRAESLQAFTYKSIHADFEDNLIVAAAQSTNMDYLVTNDANLARHALIACLSSSDMVALLNEERAQELQSIRSATTAQPVRPQRATAPTENERQYSAEEKRAIAAFCSEMIELLNDMDEESFLEGERGDSFFRFGFEMDCGKSWISQYGERAFNDSRAMDELYEQSTCSDIFLLGSAIFSQWRYWNHWSWGPMDTNAYMWFVIAFHMLENLCTEEHGD